LLVPVLLLAILLVWQFARNERGHVEERARAAAQRAIVAVDLELQQLQALAVTLKRSDSRSTEHFGIRVEEPEDLKAQLAQI